MVLRKHCWKAQPCYSGVLPPSLTVRSLNLSPRLMMTLQQKDGRIRFSNGAEETLLEGPAVLFRRTATVTNGAQLKPEPAPDDDIAAYRPKGKVDASTYQVYRDNNGVAYLPEVDVARE